MVVAGILAIKKDPTALKLLHKPFPFYDQWSIIFGKDKATGERAEGPADDVEELDEKEVAEFENNFNESFNGTKAYVSVRQTPNNVITGPSRQSGYKKMSGNGNLLAASIGEMADAFQGFADDAKNSMSVIASRIGHEVEVSANIRVVFGELSRVLNLSADDIMRAASIPVNDSAKIDIFMSLPNSFREVWVVKLLGGIDHTLALVLQRKLGLGLCEIANNNSFRLFLLVPLLLLQVNLREISFTRMSSHVDIEAEIEATIQAALSMELTQRSQNADSPPTPPSPPPHVLLDILKLVVPIQDYYSPLATCWLLEAFLIGPGQQIRMMLDPVRVYATAICVGCVVVALISARWNGVWIDDPPF
ncbi:hypothetical protein F0562_026720 [Nyssa sinensis]|uniref:Uncharacterized protein n=1 Tax=Nyssa sinensis TaxID=561372 RepID=A0A5J5BBK7_9ASTE|nr:hypothetical protein F0562_026720 [Nyssa sinensis]